MNQNDNQSESSKNGLANEKELSEKQGNIED